MKTNFSNLDFEIKNYDDSNSRYRLANKVLYDFVSIHPYHTNADEIVAKVWLIGRTYAAAIERRKNKSNTPGDFYYVHVAPALSKDINGENILDKKIMSLKKYKEIDENSLPEILSVHKYLMDQFKQITELEKRSLASKYLHFHLPDLFFIYDSRVAKVITRFSGRVGQSAMNLKGVDKEYALFCFKALCIYNIMKNNKYSDCLPRVIDNLLLRYCDKNHIV